MTLKLKLNLFAQKHSGKSVLKLVALESNI